jgi:myo-inositol-hexaphosphate 3-phosphohydrolase
MAHGNMALEMYAVVRYQINNNKKPAYSHSLEMYAVVRYHINKKTAYSHFVMGKQADLSQNYQLSFAQETRIVRQ